MSPRFEFLVMRHYMKRVIASLLLAPLTGLPAADASKPSAKPNIVLILIDDFGYAPVLARSEINQPGVRAGTLPPDQINSTR
jgi:hypothetical protein